MSELDLITAFASRQKVQPDLLAVKIGLCREAFALCLASYHSQIAEDFIVTCDVGRGFERSFGKRCHCVALV